MFSLKFSSMRSPLTWLTFSLLCLGAYLPSAQASSLEKEMQAKPMPLLADLDLGDSGHLAESLFVETPGVEMPAVETPVAEMPAVETPVVEILSADEFLTESVVLPSTQPSLDSLLGEQLEAASVETDAAQLITEAAEPLVTATGTTALIEPPLVPAGIDEGAIAAEPGQSVRSRALNISALRAVKKPLSDRVLDTGFSTPFRQRPDNPTFWTRDFLSGDWGGYRDKLYNQGIDLYALQIVDAYVQPTGGQDQSSAINSLSLIGTDLYTGRLGWWDGGQLHITAAWIETESLSQDSIGALNSTYFNDAPTNGVRMFEVWYGQKFANNRAEVRLGTQYPFVRIASNQPAAMFTNTAFDYPHFLGTTPDLGMSLPYAAAPFGVQFSYTVSPKVFLIGQISDGFQDPSGGIDNYRNTSVGLSAEEGLEGILELSYKLNQQREATGLPGNYKAGVQFHTGQFNVNNTATSETTQRWNGALYAMADQMLYAEPDQRIQGLTGFVKTVYTPYEDINTIDFHGSAGLSYEGLIPGRDRDVFGLAIAYSQISGGLRDADRLANTSVRGGETVAEMIYSADLAPWWTLIGSVQYIIDPGGFSDREDALVLGLSSRFAF